MRFWARVSRDRVTLGRTGAPSRAVAIDAALPEHLAAELATIAAAEHGRVANVLEVAADDDARFGDLAALIDAAAVAGFPDWELTTPSSAMEP